ncbi:hypothetical protein Hanom_Chr00s012135g01748691 [Helianthus anomalus]
MSNREPKDLCIACHSSEVNRASRSEMIECKTREDHNDINQILVRARKSNTRRFKM